MVFEGNKIMYVSYYGLERNKVCFIHWPYKVVGHVDGDT